MVKDVKDSLPKLSDEDVFELLDAVSEEVKRRNSLLGPTVSDVRNAPVEQTAENFIEALRALGIRFEKKELCFTFSRTWKRPCQFIFSGIRKQVRAPVVTDVSPMSECLLQKTKRRRTAQLVGVRRWAGTSPMK